MTSSTDTSFRPQRVQLKRTKGWRMPDNTVNVARPGIWGNPYRIGKEPFINTAADAVESFRWMLLRGAGWDYPGTPAIKTALRGKNLACWCKPGEPCHADILLEVAND